MLLNQTDVVVDEDLEKVIIPIDSSTEGTMSRATSTFPEKTTETSSETEACLQLGWLHPVPNVEN